MADLSFGTTAPLAAPYISATVDDINIDGDTDKFSIRFQDENFIQYELVGQADPDTHQWGEGSTLSLYLGQGTSYNLKLLVHYEAAPDGSLRPAESADNTCRLEPQGLNSHNRDGVRLLHLPDGTNLEVSLPLDREGSIRPGVRIMLTPRDGGGFLEFVSESVIYGEVGPSKASVTQLVHGKPDLMDGGARPLPRGIDHHWD